MRRDLVTMWIAALAVVSVVAWRDGGALAGWLGLVPERVWHGQVWRLVTWIFIAMSPFGLLVTCGVIYRFGGQLAVRWGERRLRRFVLEIAVVAGVATCAIAAVTGTGRGCHYGGLVLVDVLVIAFARQFPLVPVQPYPFLVLNGSRLVAVVVAFNVLLALYLGLSWAMPELAACAAAALYPRGWLAR